MRVSLLAAVFVLAGCSACRASSAEPVEEAPQPASAAYCSTACDLAGQSKCVVTVDACDNDGRNFVRYGDYVLSCRDAISSSCGGPWGQSQCSAGCRGER